MGKEDFIQGKHDTSHHSGRHSTLRRLQGAFDQLAEWRKQRTLSHKGGHKPDEFPFAGQPQTFKDLYPEAEGEELEIFLNPDWIYDVSRTDTVYDEAMQGRAYPKSVNTLWDEQEG